MSCDMAFGREYSGALLMSRRQKSIILVELVAGDLDLDLPRFVSSTAWGALDAKVLSRTFYARYSV